jgi:hypothetical protein
MEELQTTDELTRAALDNLEGYDRSDYNQDRAYGNILSDETHGKTQNWDSASSGFVPANTVDFIKSFDTIAEGIAATAVAAIQEFESYSGVEVFAHQVIGVVKKIAGRFGRGADGEVRVESFLKARGEEIASPQPADENKGIDIRTTDGDLYQVKRADSYRSDWGNNSVKVLWIKPTGEIYSPYGKDGYKDVTKLN